MNSDDKSCNRLRLSSFLTSRLRTIRVIPVFEIPEGTVKFASAMLGWDLQIALDPRITGFGGDIMGRSSTVKAAALHNRTVREILSYIVLNSRVNARTGLAFLTFLHPVPESWDFRV